MSDSDIARQLQRLNQRIGLGEVIERPLSSSGTWTPTYIGLATAGATTYLIQEGEYTQIGRIVICNGRINWSAATGTGQAAISLPFTIGNAYRSTGAVFVDGVTFANQGVQVLLLPGTAYFTLYSPLTNAAPTAVNVEAAGLIIWQITFFCLTRRSPQTIELGASVLSLGLSC